MVASVVTAPGSTVPLPPPGNAEPTAQFAAPPELSYRQRVGRLYDRVVHPRAWSRGWWFAAACAATIVAYVVLGPYQAQLLDGQVYLDALARVFDNGGSVYEEAPGALKYTYPPISLLLFSPLALVPGGLQAALFTGVSVLCLGRTIQLIAGATRRGTPLWAYTLPLLAGTPVFGTLGFGQVNLILLWLVVEDIYRWRGRWYSGLGLGLAAAVKLTPLFIIGVMFLACNRRLSIRAGACFLAATAVGAAIWPADSLEYWTRLVFDASRVGSPEYIFNQSLNGLLWRLLGPGGSRASLLILVLIVVALCVVAARWLSERPAPTTTLALSALGMLLVSPISWAHHWVWVLPALCLLHTWRATPEHSRHRRRTALIFLISAFMVFSLLQLWLLPNAQHVEFALKPWQHVLAAAYPWWATAMLVWCAALAVRRIYDRTASRTLSPPPPA